MSHQTTLFLNLFVMSTFPFPLVRSLPMYTGSSSESDYDINSDIEILDEDHPVPSLLPPPSIAMDVHEGWERLRISRTLKRESGDCISINYFYKVVSSSLMNDDILYVRKESNGRVLDNQLELLREISRYSIIDDSIREESDMSCIICFEIFLSSDKIFILNSRNNKCQNTIFCEDCIQHQLARCPQCSTPCNGYSLNAPLMSILSKVSLYTNLIFSKK